MAKRKLQLEPSRTSAAAHEASTSDSAPVKRKKVVASDFQPVDPKLLPEDAKLDLADAEIYYVEDFLCDAATAKRWYDELVELDTCVPIHRDGKLTSANVGSRVSTYAQNVRP